MARIACRPAYAGWLPSAVGGDRDSGTGGAVLLDVAPVVELERQRLGRAEDVDTGDDHLDPGGQIGIGRLSGRADDPGNPHAELEPSRCAPPQELARLGFTTTWAMPEASRRSTKITPPWSRRLSTQPATRPRARWRRPRPLRRGFHRFVPMVDLLDRNTLCSPGRVADRHRFSPTRRRHNDVSSSRRSATGTAP